MSTTRHHGLQSIAAFEATVDAANEAIAEGGFLAVLEVFAVEGYDDDERPGATIVVIGDDDDDLAAGIEAVEAIYAIVNQHV